MHRPDKQRPTVAAMATAATQRVQTVPRPQYQPIIQLKPTQDESASTAFDPARHLAFKEPPETIKMTDIGYAEDTGVSPVAVSQPFRLFSQEAILKMREEIFKKEVMENCSFKSNIAACQLRGYAKKYAPFAYDAWNHPQTLAVLSKIAGLEIVPAMDYEIGHINLSVKTEEETQAELEVISKQKSYFADDEGISGCPWEDNKPVVGWHTDSYPFVCVLMMSDCTNMVGGETALRTGTGDVMKVRGPEMGCAVILQGRYITHQALRALGAQERITSVTSFRPKSAHLADDTELRTVRPVSDLSELYYDFGEYRLEILEERIRAKLKQVKSARRAGRKCDTLAFKKFLQEQETFLRRTNEELVDERDVKVGFIEEIDYPDAIVGDAVEGPRPAKRSRIE